MRMVLQAVASKAGVKVAADVGEQAVKKVAPKVVQEAGEQVLKQTAMKTGGAEGLPRHRFRFGSHGSYG